MGLVVLLWLESEIEVTIMCLRLNIIVSYGLFDHEIDFQLFEIETSQPNENQTVSLHVR